MRHFLTLFSLFAVVVVPCAFAADVLEDNFQGELADGWSWIREVPDQHRFAEGGGLEIKMEPNPDGGIRNILVRRAPKIAAGRFIVELEVDSDVPFSNQFQQVGLYWLQGDDLKFKFVKEFIDGEQSVYPEKLPLATQRVTLRLDIDGQKLSAWFKPAGEDEFRKACEATLPQRNDALDRIAIQCWHGPADSECWTKLLSFKIICVEE